MGIKTVCTMSGLPAGNPADTMPNWVVSSWPPETQGILKYQWEEKLFPFWTEIVALANECGVERIALELHGNQCVYNVPSLLKLRQQVGPIVGANLDPSHPFWMGADPLIAAEALGEAVYHVHAKDTFLNAPKQAEASLLENGSLTDIPARSWSYITLGFGHGEEWWRQFCYRLKVAGYDGSLSIEHEDVLLNSLEGLEKSVALLKAACRLHPPISNFRKSKKMSFQLAACAEMLWRAIRLVCRASAIAKRLGGAEAICRPTSEQDKGCRLLTVANTAKGDAEAASRDACSGALPRKEKMRAFLHAAFDGSKP